MSTSATCESPSGAVTIVAGPLTRTDQPAGAMNELPATVVFGVSAVIVSATGTAAVGTGSGSFAAASIAGASAVVAGGAGTVTCGLPPPQPTATRRRARARTRIARTISQYRRGMRAITREVPACFADALSAVPPDPPINVDRARRQHAAYVDALGGCGISVAVISNRDLPDGCFVEDTAVVADGLALITRPGAPSRQAELRGVESELSGLVEIARM